MMKILYVITLSDLGGAQNNLLEMIKWFKNKNNLISVVVGNEGWLTDNLAQMDIKYIVISNMMRKISFQKDLHSFFCLRNVIKEQRPDIVHCHSSKAGIVGRAAAWLEGVPSIFTAHGWAFTEGVPLVKRVVYSVIENMMLSISGSIICVSDYDRLLAEKWFLRKSEKMVTVHNGIEDIGKNLRRDFTCDKLKDGLNIIMVGRFAIPKDQLQLIKAVEFVNKKFMNRVHLTLVGDGNLFASAAKYIKANGLTGTVILLGQRNDISDLLIKNDVFCLISNYEGLPISIIEAMRAGLPVIASDVGGNNELVQDSVNGFLVERGNFEQLVEKISYCLEHKDILQVMGNASRAIYMKEFSARQMMEKINSVYCKILCLGVKYK